MESCQPVTRLQEEEEVEEKKKKTFQHLRSFTTIYNLYVAGSIPDCVIGIFVSHKPTGRTITLGVILPPKEMSIKNNSSA
jgi:hypothetical protein